MKKKLREDFAGFLKTVKEPDHVDFAREVLLMSLTPRQQQAFEVAVRNAPVTYNEVRVKLGISRVQASRLLKELFELGLLTRDDNQVPYVYDIKYY